MGKYKRAGGFRRAMHNLVKHPRWFFNSRKHTRKNRRRPDTIIGYPSRKGKGQHKVEYKNTWGNRVKRLTPDIG